MGEGTASLEKLAKAHTYIERGASGRISSVGILSTKLGGGTTRMSGTSMAAPHVTGVVALLYQVTKGLTSEQVRVKLMLGADNANAPLASPTSCYSPDGDLEGVVYAPEALTR